MPVRSGQDRPIMNDTQFQKNLEEGIYYENKVYDYLIANNSYVEDSRHQKYEPGSGPRLRGTSGTLVLPDFTVYNKFADKGNYAVDVKFKRSIYPAHGKMCFTVDNKYLDYKRIVEIKKLDFLALAFVYENKVYFYKDSDCIGDITYDNQYSKGKVYLFEHDITKIKYIIK